MVKPHEPAARMSSARSHSCSARFRPDLVSPPARAKLLGESCFKELRTVKGLPRGLCRLRCHVRRGYRGLAGLFW